MSIRIGSVYSIGKTENFSVNPDDRQELVQLVDGAVCIDGWGGTRNSDGDIVSLTATFTKSDAEIVIALWSGRVLTSVALENGETIANARVIVRRINYTENVDWRNKYTILDLEIWRV